MSVRNEILSALDEQLGCYRRLAKLADVQHEYVQQSQMEGLLDVLRSRQQVLDELTRLEAVIGPAKKRWSEFLAEIGSDERSQAEGLVVETRRLLERITTSDQNDALVLQQRKLNLGKQITQASSAKQRNRSYAAAAYGKPVARMDVQR